MQIGGGAEPPCRLTLTTGSAVMTLLTHSLTHLECNKDTAALDRTSENVENGGNERLDVMFAAADDAESQRRHHDNEAADDHRRRFSYRTYRDARNATFIDTIKTINYRNLQ